MFDNELVSEILQQVYEATQKILTRFDPIRSVDDLTNSEAGMEKLDAICMQLIAIGESIKNLDRMTENELLPKYPTTEWKMIMGLRVSEEEEYEGSDIAECGMEAYPEFTSAR